MYLNKDGYAELFQFSPPKIDPMPNVHVAFERCAVTFSTIAVGGTYAEKFPDVSEDDMREYAERVRDHHGKIAHAAIKTENARTADVLMFGIVR